MNELELAAGVLAAVALPLVGIGPVLLRTLPPVVVASAMALCAAVVWLLTREPWATAFTLCLGAAVLLRHHRRRAARLRAAAAPRAPRSRFAAPRADGEADPA